MPFIPDLPLGIQGMNHTRRLGGMGLSPLGRGSLTFSPKSSPSSARFQLVRGSRTGHLRHVFDLLSCHCMSCKEPRTTSLHRVREDNEPHALPFSK